MLHDSFDQLFDRRRRGRAYEVTSPDGRIACVWAGNATHALARIAAAEGFSVRRVEVPDAATEGQPTLFPVNYTCR
jgi:hypothetical protein